VSELHRTNGRGSGTAWLTWPGCGARIVGALLVGLAAIGCESQRTPSPTGPTFTFQPTTVSVRIQGQVLDVDRNVPAPGTTVTLKQVGVPGAYRSVSPAPRTTADERASIPRCP